MKYKIEYQYIVDHLLRNGIKCERVGEQTFETDLDLENNHVRTIGGMTIANFDSELREMRKYTWKLSKDTERTK